MSEYHTEYQRKARKRRVKPPKKTGLGFSEWMVKHYLVHRTADEETHWDPLAYLTMLADTMEQALRSDTAETVVLWKGAQLGFSHLATGFHAWHLLENDGRVLIVLPHEVISRQFYNAFVAPAHDRLPDLSRLRDANKNWQLVKGKHKVFDTGAVLLVQGGGKADRYRSSTVELTMLDEYDAYPQDLDEGDCLSLSMRGVRTRRGLVVAGSTPSSAQGTSQICAAWQDANRQWVWVVLCPRCDQHTDITWARMKFDADGDEHDRAESVRQECGRCGEPFTFDELPAAIEGGTWQPAEVEEGRFPTPIWEPVELKRGPRAGFAISGLCSVWDPWPDVVRRWLTAQGDQQKLKAFFEQTLATPYQFVNPDLDFRDLQERLVQPEDIPDDYRLHVVSLDVQGPEGEGGWLIAYDYLLGPLNDEGVHPAVLARRTRFEGRVDSHTSGTAWEAFRRWFGSQACVLHDRPPHIFVYDIGHHMGPALRSARLMRFSRRFAVRGVSGWSKPTYQRSTAKNKADGHSYVFYNLGVDELKSSVQRNFKSGVWRIADMDGAMEAIDELIAEAIVESEREGRRYHKWKLIPGAKRNEALDCSGYALAAVAMAKIVDIAKLPLVSEMAKVKRPRQRRRQSALRSMRRV